MLRELGSQIKKQKEFITYYWDSELCNNGFSDFFFSHRIPFIILPLSLILGEQFYSVIDDLLA